jgi:hypothetical protein
MFLIVVFYCEQLLIEDWNDVSVHFLLNYLLMNNKHLFLVTFRLIPWAGPPKYKIAEVLCDQFYMNNEPDFCAPRYRIVT